MKQKLAQAVRALTTPPVFSALMCTLLYVLVRGSFASLGHYVLAIVCLSLLPVIGITLPFFSAGGTSLFCLYLGVGLVLSVYRHRNSRTIYLHD